MVVSMTTPSIPTASNLKKKKMKIQLLRGGVDTRPSHTTPALTATEPPPFVKKM
jgi:hypothetical protein